jgi:phosphoglycolate phosphatase
MRAFYRAIRYVFAIHVDREVIRPDGKTDPMIAREILEYFGQGYRWNEESREALFAVYLRYLEEEMEGAKESGSLRILAGVTELLNRLTCQPDLGLGLVTGNLQEGARIKLAKAGLESYFRFGGYGSDSDDRTTLIRIGMERGAKLMSPVLPEAAFVIGDTPLDILHGRAAGARVIAVASARYTLEDLHSYNPDLLLPDLTSSDRIISCIRN